MNQLKQTNRRGSLRWLWAWVGLLCVGLVAPQVAQAEQIRVNTSPRGARLYVNGVFKGRTPMLLQLDAGRYHLELRRKGYLTWATYMPLPSRTKMRLQIALEKMSPRATAQNSGDASDSGTSSGGPSVDFNNAAPGQNVKGLGGKKRTGLLIINSKPPGASVYRDGRLIGRTPLLATLPLGSHSLEFRQEGYATLTRGIQVTSKGSTKVDVTMRKQAGAPPPRRRTGVDVSSDDSGSGTQLVIMSKPPAAKVYLNGRLLGQTPVLSAGLAPGPYKLVLRHKGYSPYRRSLDLKAGQQLRVRVQLIKR